MKSFEIVDTSGWPATKAETLGTKVKDWLADEADRRWLFKLIRPTTGDDWAEKVAAELASLVGLPRPDVEMARRDAGYGSISLDFTRVGGEHRWSLVTGNELLWRLDPDYPKEQRWGARAYTVDRVLDVLLQQDLASTATADGTRLSATESFVGYLLFDAWIGNQDRHHENWGILQPAESGSEARPQLAPSFDHASSLGQTLPDAQRRRRLEIQDKGHVSHWVRKAKSALYGAESDPKPLSTFDAFRRASRREPGAAAYWVGRLSAVGSDAWIDLLAALPDERVSSLAREFAAEMLRLNRRDLLAEIAP